MWTSWVKCADDGAEEMCQIVSGRRAQKKTLTQIACKLMRRHSLKARQPFISVEEEQHLALSEVKHFGDLFIISKFACFFLGGLSL